jgi:hypothetical protein
MHVDCFAGDCSHDVLEAVGLSQRVACRWLFARDSLINLVYRFLLPRMCSHSLSFSLTPLCCSLVTKTISSSLNDQTKPR